jgi:ribonuclease P protein component
MGETVRNRASLRDDRQRPKETCRPLTATVRNQHTYGREDRLKSRKRIEALFREGKRMHAGPLTLVYRFHRDNPSPLLQAGMTVRSKQFRLAVDRNRIKRLLREAYRQQKQPLRDLVLQGTESLDLFLLYTGKVLPEYTGIFASTGEVIRKMLDRHERAS